MNNGHANLKRVMKNTFTRVPIDSSTEAFVDTK